MTEVSLQTIYSILSVVVVVVENVMKVCMPQSVEKQLRKKGEGMCIKQT